MSESLALCKTCHVWHVVEMRDRKDGDHRPHPRPDVRYASRHRGGTGFGQITAAFEALSR